MGRGRKRTDVHNSPNILSVPALKHVISVRKNILRWWDLEEKMDRGSKLPNILRVSSQKHVPSLGQTSSADGTWKRKRTGVRNSITSFVFPALKHVISVRANIFLWWDLEKKMDRGSSLPSNILRVFSKHVISVGTNVFPLMGRGRKRTGVRNSITSFVFPYLKTRYISRDKRHPLIGRGD
ncbi:hypothetical protein AVEN_1630-1 [Araneus ventricosus]|uniref:Uncharacterized protein n=1 Tax=Araneus ventricosus TaxID=182803 RepID=A0A4Y2R2Q8_ARAVE|nr:hypothetical protein AVEN_1630-1 [Araneus ventricosus]